MTTVTIAVSGRDFTETWRSVSGATGVEVDAARLELGAAPAGSTRSVGTVAGAATDVNHLVVTIPGGERSLRTLKLNGFSRRDGDETVQIHDAGDLDQKLAVAVIDTASGQTGAPVHVIPPVPQRGSVPPQLGGATFAGRILSLPDLRAARLDLTRVHNDFPEEFETQEFSVSSVDATVAPYPEGLSVTGPDGALLFALPGPFGPGNAPALVDLRVPFELALAAALDAGAALSACFTVSAAVEGDVQTDGIDSSGAVLRAFPDPAVVGLTGAAVSLPLPGAPLDSRMPMSATADVTVSYDGLRLHELSAVVPADAGGLGGPVVGPDPVLSSFPTQALHGERLRRVGLVGRPVGETDLSVRVVRVVGGTAGEPLGDPGVATITPSGLHGGDPPQVVWVEFPAPIDIAPPCGITVAATRGSFRWVAGPSPLVLLAVVDADPAGRPVQIGATTLPVKEAEQTYIGLGLASASFAVDPPVASSDLFCTVHLANLVLRYEP